MMEQVQSFSSEKEPASASLLNLFPVVDLEKLKTRVSDLVASNNLKLAIFLFRDALVKNSAAQNEVLALQSSFFTEEKSYTEGIIDEKTYTFTKNQLDSTILENLSILKDTDLKTHKLLANIPFPEEPLDRNRVADQNRVAIRREKNTSFKPLTNHLLIIGIDDYKDANISPLYNAVKDAQAIKKVLLEQYEFDEGNTTCLFNEEATRSNILTTFEQLLNNLTENDNLVFYYSGHGELVKRGKKEKGYWLPANAIAGETHSYIANNDIVDLYVDSYAHHIFGIVDSCFSDSFFVGKRNITVEKKEITWKRPSSFPSRIVGIEAGLFYHPSRWLLTAGFLEPVSDGSLGDNSPFAKTLLYYLNDNKISSLWVSELCNQVLRGLEDNIKNQTPRGEPLHDVGHYGGQFIFYKKGYMPNRSTSTPPKTVSITPTPPETTAVKKSFKDLNDLKIYLKILVEEDIGQALKVYKSSLASDSRKINDIIGQLGRYNRSTKDFNSGLSIMEQRNIAYARIRYALTQMIDDLKQEDIGIAYETGKQMEYENTKGETIQLDLEQLEQKGLQQRATLLIEKIHRLQEALDLEDDPTRSFKYEKQLEQAEEQLRVIKEQIR